MFRFILIFSFVLLAITSKANDSFKLSHQEFQLIVEYQTQHSDFSAIPTVTSTVKFKRGKAIIFTLLTGLFGGHRIYFGTHHRTPIIYSVTLGGLGVLPIVDLINIIFTKDLKRFENNPQIIMWGK